MIPRCIHGLGSKSEVEIHCICFEESLRLEHASDDSNKRSLAEWAF